LCLAHPVYSNFFEKNHGTATEREIERVRNNWKRKTGSDELVLWVISLSSQYRV
jgi:hypothetical protein